MANELMANLANTFVQHGCINLFKSYSKEMYNVISIAIDYNRNKLF